MGQAKAKDLMAVSPAALECGWPREKLIRALQRRDAKGAYLGGRWYIERGEVERLATEKIEADRVAAEKSVAVVDA